jgi:hypothetical protein
MGEIKRELGLDEMDDKGIEAFLEKLMGDIGGMDKPAKKINIVVTVDGKEESNLNLETLFFVGIHDGGLSNNGPCSKAAMAAGVVGRYDHAHATHMRSQIFKLLEQDVNA